MKSDIFWDKFFLSGKISDYIDYKHSVDAEFSTEVASDADNGEGDSDS
ncbi:MAG: hypothetical protein ACI4JX_03950 [Oscillospiraceae bacterium]